MDGTYHHPHDPEGINKTVNNAMQLAFLVIHFILFNKQACWYKQVTMIVLPKPLHACINYK